MTRLNKYIAECGVCSRRSADTLIQSGKVIINEQVVTNLGTKIDENKDIVKVNGKIITKENKLVYIMLNKLELTWYNKYEQKNIEPRILVENKEKSYGNQDTENILIHGDNLLALKALENKYANQVKCIYIDPPYNTGSAFDNYDDNLEHSIWLNLMNERLKTKEGESSFEVRERMFSAISEILQNNLNKRIAIVSHGAVIKYYLQNFCEFDSANDVFLLKR